MILDYNRKDDGLDKSARKGEIKRLRETLVGQQQAIREAKLPVVVLSL